MLKGFASIDPAKWVTEATCVYICYPNTGEYIKLLSTNRAYLLEHYECEVVYRQLAVQIWPRFKKGQFTLRSHMRGRAPHEKHHPRFVKQHVG